MQLSAQQWQKAQQIFELIIDVPEDQRSSLLKKHCHNQKHLIVAVQKLIEKDQELHTFLPLQASSTLTQIIEDHELVADIGRYRLLKKLGAGGMGQVYLAERSDEEFQKQVVIKLIRHDQMTDEYSQSQFRQERQTLANLEHPNIAQLLDGGTLENGTPYVVMTHVQGQPITTFCRNKKLTWVQRIQLFIELCSAIEYAHQKLVLHRDIKPANILVTAQKQIQLLDFGIAQSFDNRKQNPLVANSGTPGYASPEQLSGKPQFASSDIYSLGVLLFELIFDQRPYSGSNTQDLLIAMQQDIDFDHFWNNINTKQPQQKSNLWRRELQAICQKTKAQALVEILLNAYQDADPTHTRGELVSAREILDQSLHHINKQLDHQDPIRIELKSTLSTVYNNLGLYEKAEKIAQQAAEEAKNSKHIDSQILIKTQLNWASILSESGASATSILSIIEPIFYHDDFNETKNNELRWKAMKLKGIALNRQAKSIKAIELYHQILNEQQVLLTHDNELIIESLYDLGHLTYYDGHGVEGEKLMFEAYQRLGQNQLYSHQLRSKVTQGMANIFIRDSNISKAHQLYNDFYQQTLEIYGSDHPAIGPVINKLAEINYRLNNIEQSIDYFQQFVTLSEKFYGASHIKVAFAKFNLAHVLETKTTNIKRAIILYEQAINIGHDYYQSQHKNLGYFYRSLGQLYLKQKSPDLAKPYLQESLANYIYANAPKGRNIAKARLLMAQVYDQLRVKKQAQMYLDLALPVLEKNYPAENEFVQQAKTLQRKIRE